jgi:hypothetical protein
MQESTTIYYVIRSKVDLNKCIDIHESETVCITKLQKQNTNNYQSLQLCRLSMIENDDPLFKRRLGGKNEYSNNL